LSAGPGKCREESGKRTSEKKLGQCAIYLQTRTNPPQPSSGETGGTELKPNLKKAFRPIPRQGRYEGESSRIEKKPRRLYPTASGEAGVGETHTPAGPFLGKVSRPFTRTAVTMQEKNNVSATAILTRTRRGLSFYLESRSRHVQEGRKELGLR